MQNKTETDESLFYDLLYATHQLLAIVNSVKLKLDDFLRPHSQRHLSEEQRSEFIKALISHLAFSTNKMIDTVPDLNEASQSKESTLLRDFLTQEANFLREIVYTFVKAAQNRQDLNEYLSQENIQRTSKELDETLAHMEQTIILLEKDSIHIKKMNEYLSRIDIIIKTADVLIDVVLDAQNVENTQQSIENLRAVGIEFSKELASCNDTKDISTEIENIISFVIEEANLLSNVLTHDPVYSEQQATNISKQVKTSCYQVLCNLQHQLIQYKLRIPPKQQEVVDLSTRKSKHTRKANSLGHVETTSIQNDHNTTGSAVFSPQPKKRKMKVFGFRRKGQKSLNNIHKSQDIISPSVQSTLQTPNPTPPPPPPRVSTTKSSSLPAEEYDPKLQPNMAPLNQPNKSVQSPARAPSSPPRPRPASEERKKTENAEPEGMAPLMEINRIMGKPCRSTTLPVSSLAEDITPNAMPGSRASATFASDTKKDDEETSFQSKRPKISRMLSKSKVFKMEHKDIDTPEHRLTKSIIQILEEELPWFKEKYNQEHGTTVFRINTMIEDAVKKDLVNYGNKIRSNQPLSLMRNTATPRGAVAIAESSKAKNLNQFVSPDVLTSDSWKGLFVSTSTLLTPLEIPRLRACVSPMGKAANDLIAVGFNVVDHPTDRSLLGKLSECVQHYYERLQQITKISIEGPERAKVISFLEKPLGQIIAESPICGEVNQQLVNTVGEEYKLQMISGKVRQLVFYTANSFRALVIQIGSTIYSITEESKNISDTLIVQFVANIGSQLSQIRKFLDVVVTSREFSLVIKSSEVLPEEKRSNELSDTLFGENIWEAAPIQHNPEMHLGTLNSFVLRLTETENEVDNYFMKAFLATYQSFTTPLQLFTKLLERYNVPDHVDESLAKKVRLRVVIVLKYWIQTQFYDINNQLLEKITAFLSTIRESGQELIGKQLENLLIQKEEDRKISIRKIEMGELPPLDTNQLYDLNPVSPAHVLFTSDALQIAKQITMHECSVFHAIEPSELLNQAWSKPDLRYQSPNVLRFIHSLNKLSFWVATSILWYSNVDTRSKVVEKFITIAKHLRKLGNFNSLMGILGGLNLGCISRLKKTFAGISDKASKEFKNLNESLMSPKASWKAYREALQAQGLPRLPYLGVHLSDLAFIGDGNASVVDGLLNFDKHLMVYKVLEQILICQQQKYVFEQTEPLRTFYAELPSLGEDEMWQLSQTWEAKAS